MSADNWATCPECEKRAKQAQADLLSRVETDYGKVTAAEYLELIEQSRQPITEKCTLREDYEIGIWEGEFHVSYGAHCEECGFSHEFGHREKV